MLKQATRSKSWTIVKITIDTHNKVKVKVEVNIDTREKGEVMDDCQDQYWHTQGQCHER